MKIGYDIYTSDLDEFDLYDYIQQHQIQIYHLQKNTMIRFSSLYKYRKILMSHEKIHYQYTIGLLGMIFRFLHKEKIIACLLSCLWLMTISSTIFDIKIFGESVAHKKMIEELIGYDQLPFLYHDSKTIYQSLKQLNHRLNWYEVIRKGSRLEIYYLPRYEEYTSDTTSYDLVASKDCVIAGFDVSKGNIVVDVNQKVNQGDVLVSHILLNSSQEEKTSEVIGKVYGYTFQKIEIEMEKTKLPLSIQYFIGLMQSRMKIDLDKDEYIVKEISLHFEEDFDKIRMSNYYVLYQVVSVVGDSYE